MSVQLLLIEAYLYPSKETQVGVRNAAAAFSRAVSRICVIDGIDAPTPEHLRSLFDRVADCNEVRFMDSLKYFIQEV